MKLTFFGSYLSRTSGSKGPSETIIGKLQKKGLNVKLVSRARRFLVRGWESTMHVCFSKIDLAFFDVYSTRVVYLSGFLATILRLRKIPYVCILHGGGLPDRYEEISGTLVPLLKGASQIITPSVFLKKFFHSKGIEADHIANPLNTELFAYRPRKAEETTGVIKLLWVRAFAHIYEPEMPISILDLLDKRGIAATLSMVGPDKGVMDACKKRSQQLGLDGRIEFVGPVKNEDLVPYYQSHTVFLNTTRYESFGLAVSEAAACGLPCVSNAVGELVESWADGKNIILTDGTLEGYVAGISRLLKEDGLYESVSRSAREKVENFSWDRVSPLWENLLKAHGWSHG